MCCGFWSAVGTEPGGDGAWTTFGCGLEAQRESIVLFVGPSVPFVD